MHKPSVTAFTVVMIISSLLLTGCGQTGPLYHPGEETPYGPPHYSIFHPAKETTKTQAAHQTATSSSSAVQDNASGQQAANSDSINNESEGMEHK